MAVPRPDRNAFPGNTLLGFRRLRHPVLKGVAKTPKGLFEAPTTFAAPRQAGHSIRRSRRAIFRSRARPVERALPA